MNKPTPLETLLKQTKRKLASYKASLPYADGQQYYRDLDTIKELESDLSFWMDVQARLNEQGTTLVSEAANDVPALLKEQAS